MIRKPRDYSSQRDLNDDKLRDVIIQWPEYTHGNILKLSRI